MAFNNSISQILTRNSRINKEGWMNTAAGKKLVNYAVYAGLFLFAIIVGYLSVFQPILAVATAGLAVGFTVLLICLLNAEAGLYICMCYSFFICFFDRLLFNGDLLEGIFLDLLTVTTFFGFFVRRDNIVKDFNELAKTAVGTLILIVYGYTILEVFNPSAFSLAGAVPSLRKIVGAFLLLLISFSIFKNHAAIKRFLKVLFVLCFATGLYSCLQEFHGFFDFEVNWLRSNEKRYSMTFVNGGARRMSFFPDALSVSIVMAICGVLFSGLAIIQKVLWKKIVMIIAVLVMILGMSYSLTRTANVMMVAGFALFLFMTLDTKLSKVLAIAGGLVFLFLLYVPYYNNNQINQFKSTFRAGTKDASYLVREKNRKSIQPYILSHPFGGGLSTTGDEGLLYHPGHRLAGFPPDSGYLKKALELGWVGLLMSFFLYFSVARTGVRGYFLARDRKTKIVFASLTSAVFGMYIGDFSQVAIGQITDVVVYFPIIAIILRLKKRVETIKTNELYETT
jgi:putative inorganic carbon (hco3(-)) transporter